jgi:hypothetical protein
LTPEQRALRKKERRRAHYLKNKERDIARALLWHKNNRERWMFTRRLHRKKLKEQVIAHLGGKCKHCGFADVRALQIDHVFNDGYAERKKTSGIRNSATCKYLRHVLADEEGRYQLLCANCNWIKFFEDKEAGKYKPLALAA